MPCERFAGELIDHAAGGELPSSVRAHLDGCADCREALASAKREMADLDRDLEKMLAAEPSVEFAARVRQRIDRERNAGPSWLAWRWAFGAAAAAILIVAVVMTIRDRGPVTVPHGNPPPTVATRATGNPVPDPIAPPVVVAPAEPLQRVAIARRPTRPNTTAEPARVVRAEPEVLIPPDQRIAVARLIELTRRGRVDSALFDENVPPPIVTADVSPLVVTEMEVPVLPAPGGATPGGGAGRGLERH